LGAVAIRPIWLQWRADDYGFPILSRVSGGKCHVIDKRFRQQRTAECWGSVTTTVRFIPETPQAGPSGTTTFCGDVVNGFVLNTFTTVNFSQGQGCSNIVSMVPNALMSVTGVVVINQLVSGASPAQTLVGFAPQTGAMVNVTFCGDVTRDFTTNASSTVHFIQGQTCATIVSGLTV